MGSVLSSSWLFCRHAQRAAAAVAAPPTGPVPIAAHLAAQPILTFKTQIWLWEARGATCCPTASASGVPPRLRGFFRPAIGSTRLG